MKKQVLILVFITLLINSCKTDDLELSNGSAISTATFPTNLAELKGGINATYSPLQSQGLYGRYLFFMYDYMADEVQIGTRGSADLVEFKNYTFTPANNDIYLYWKNAYNGVSRANFILDKQDNIAAIEESVISQDLKDKFVGEAKFLRAYYYFLLVSRFGDIPLYTTTDVSPNGLPKSPKEDVYQLIISDLTDAATKLYLKSAEEPGRATQGAANALLGKVHLYRGEYPEAKTAFNKVINSGEYSLTANYYDNFENANENNSESVFEIQFTYNGDSWAYSDWGGQDNGNSETTFRSAEYGAVGGWHNNDPSEDLVAEFEAGDSRTHASFYFAGDPHATGTMTQGQIGTGITATWRKYQLSFSTYSDLPGLSDINMRAIRYSDVLLMAAEAENEAGGDPVGLLNQVRDRAAMPNYGTVAMNATYPVGTSGEIFTAIVHERRVELAGEQVRFPDLVRWNMTSLIPGFQTGKHEVLPIPQTELDTNLSLSSADQNAGY